jgi:hypothetical protein
MRMRIPSLLLTKLYVRGSLCNVGEGFQVTMKNVLTPGTVVKFLSAGVDGRKYPPEEVFLLVSGTERIEGIEISPQAPLSLGLGKEVVVRVRAEGLSVGSHEIVLSFVTKEVGELKVPIRDTIEG